MAFVVEDGSQVSGANSYTSVAEATTYLAANIHASAAWVALITSDKELLLEWASRYLDQRARWNGTPTSQATSNPVQQAMRWPRSGVKDVDGNVIASDTIPKALKDAVAEMARYLIADDRSVERPQDFLTELRAADVTLKFKDAVLAIVPSEVSFIIRGLGTISSGRFSFAKITRA